MESPYERSCLGGRWEVGRKQNEQREAGKQQVWQLVCYPMLDRAACGPLLQAVISLLGAGIRILLLLGQWVPREALGHPHSPVSQHGLSSLHRTGGETGV